MPRIKSQKHKKIENGYYFIGADGYLQTTFWSGRNNKEKIYNIAFVILADGSSYLELAGETEGKYQYLDLLQNAVGEFRVPSNRKRRWIRDFKGENYIANLDLFLRDVKPKIDDFLQANPNEYFQALEKEDCQKYIGRVADAFRDRKGVGRDQYPQYMDEQNAEGSNKASSYVRALELLGPILAKRSAKFSKYSDVFAIQSVQLIDELYEYILEQQNLGDDGIFETAYKPSYWRSRFYSAALKSYKKFLILHPYEQRLWDLYNEPDVQPAELSKRMEAAEVDSLESLIDDRDIDFSTKEGKEVLRETKARVNQGFFRKMLLDTYETQCCVSGLNIPEVLRASHIVAWSDDEENRLNPTNGLCLSATYDAAFDRHLISFDEDYRMIFSPALKEFYSNDAFKTQFLAFEGKQISKPKRFCPDQEFLQKHRDKMPF